MQIVIPMTGYGSRFVAAGYKELKPFISVLGRPIIEWIIKGIYPGETNFIFICRKEHLDTISWMREELLRIAPEARIVSIDNWVKKGPVYDVLQSSEFINDEDEIIINYCDFYLVWDWRKFKKDVRERGCEGCVPCYSNFHPHLMIEKNLYASCRVDAEENLIEIREKYSFEADKTKARHSPGVYYFKTGKIMKTYCRQMIDTGVTLKGEFYASLPYNFLVKAGLKVWVPVNVEYFCQWGTPEDLADFNEWMQVERNIRRGKERI